MSRGKTSRSSALKKAFENGGLTELFVNELGWESPAGSPLPIEIDGATFVPKVAATLKGFRVYTVECEEPPSRWQMRAVDARLGELSAERFQVFQSPTAWIWHWPRSTAAGTKTFEAIETAPAALPTFLAQRLAGLEFSVADHRNGLSLVDVRERVHGHFDASNVTKKFYDGFSKARENLADDMSGLPVEFAKEYSTTLLNRLMFLYFLQKKEFLNGDLWYLENTLGAVQRLQGRDHYFTFYRDALLPLFFEKLNDRQGVVEDPEIAAILGEVPYVNGGIFGPTAIEEEFGEQLTVPDSAFERILEFFGRYNWHLDTRPTGNEDEINPDVVGFIFEQFVNSKQMGAYYTREDVTHFMTRSTLFPVVLQRLENLGVPIWDLLQANPDRYIWPLRGHGVDHAFPKEIEDQRETHRRPLWHGDVPKQIGLAGESWWEVEARRAALAKHRRRLDGGEVRDVDDAVTENLNVEALAVDAILRVTDPDRLEAVWRALSRIAVIDPTCGSGAFLFAALNLLVPLYAATLDAIDAIGEHNHPGIAAIEAEVDRHPSVDYFLLKHACLYNLYGVDIMPEAVEVARLRLFLKLASAVDARDKLEPLPDLDFNIKAGNILVGARTEEDLDGPAVDLFVGDSQAAARASARRVGEAYSAFKAAQEVGDAEAMKQRRAALKALLAEVRDDVSRLYYAADRHSQKYETWVQASRPFHWFVEFPAVFDRGGFDVVIGNPPYIAKKKVTEYDFSGFRTDELPDIYAPCTERAAQITGPDGRLALIIPISASFGDDFSELRRVLEARFGTLWVSNFSRNPAALFSAGLGVRSTIVVGHRGGGDDRRIHVTKTHRWYDAFRPALFETLSYTILPSDVKRNHGWVRLPSADYGRIVQTADKKPGTLAALDRPRTGTASVGFKQTALYWLAVFLDDPPAYERDGRAAVQTKIGRITTENKRTALLLLAVAASKFAFVWWYVTGDDFDVTSGGLKTLPVDPSKFTSAAQEKLIDAAQRLVAGFPNHILFTPYAGKFMGTYVLAEMRDITDEIDEVIAREVGYSHLLPALEHAYACVYKPTGDRPGTLREDPFKRNGVS